MGLRSRRRRADGHTTVDGTPVIGEEHAWWAERDRLQRVFVASETETTSEPTEPPLKEFWSPESLFTYDQRDETDVDVSDIDDITDPYGVLGVHALATWGEITFAHRALAKRYHPDVVIHAQEPERLVAEEQMRRINQAYSQLLRLRKSTVR